MQFKSFAVLAALLVVTSAAAIPAPSTDLNAREVELYECVSGFKRDLEGRCHKVREAEPEPVAEPGEIYECVSGFKRDLNGRCHKVREAEAVV